MKKTKYMVIYDHYADRILNSELAAGDQLPTEYDVAETFNVSRITVRKSMKLLTEAGFITRVSGKGTFVNDVSKLRNDNICNQNIKSRKLIGVMMSNISDAFGTMFLKGLCEQAYADGYAILPHIGYASQEDEHRGVEHLISNGVKGIVIMPVHGSSYNPMILRQAILGYPIVLADIYLNGLAVPYVGSDNQGGCKKLVKHLFTLGHTNIAFISSMATTSAILERRDGFLSAYVDRNISMFPGNIYLDLRCTMPGNATEEIIRSDIDKLKTFFNNNRKITAVVAADFNVANVVRMTVEELGMKVPDDISLTCFDEPESPFTRQFYTHIRQDEYKIGKTAFNLLIDLINGTGNSPRVIVETELIEGITTKAI